LGKDLWDLPKLTTLPKDSRSPYVGAAKGPGIERTGVAVLDDSGGFHQQRRAAPQLPRLGLLSFDG
jgi:hypothetical protein